MKLAISSVENKGLKSQLSPVFGRCPYFVVVEIENKETKNVKTIKNTAAAQMGGAGITAAQLIGNEGVKVVITGAAGPRAFQVFQQLGIKVLRGIEGTVKQNIEVYLDGKLQEITTPGPMGFGGAGFGQGIQRGIGKRGSGFGQGRKR